ncbi:MAG: ABC transporter ATP-binding protein [Candidatus Doudnabacteria bacterium]|nr:ABC transporter ATP-binding protein [Candidatus Doudnabacteria bacterium]
MKPIIKTTNLTKFYQEAPGKHLLALENIDLSITEGEFFVIVGPSGSGKSTILRALSGLDTDFEGQVYTLPSINPSDLGFVFQQFALLPWLTVYENIELGLIGRNIPEAERKEVVRRELEQFGLQKFSESFPHELSGGMRQRVGIARAMATDPKILFLDEPFSELDYFSAETLRRELLEIWHKRKLTIIMVSHIIQEALELSDRIAVLSGRPGHVLKIINNTLPRPRNLRSPEFYKLEDKIYSLLKPT